MYKNALHNTWPPWSPHLGMGEGERQERLAGRQVAFCRKQKEIPDPRPSQPGVPLGYSSNLGFLSHSLDNLGSSPQS